MEFACRLTDRNVGLSVLQAHIIQGLVLRAEVEAGIVVPWVKPHTTTATAQTSGGLSSGRSTFKSAPC